LFVRLQAESENIFFENLIVTPAVVAIQNIKKTLLISVAISFFLQLIH
jgi:hypothetical protein